MRALAIIGYFFVTALLFVSGANAGDTRHRVLVGGDADLRSNREATILVAQRGPSFSGTWSTVTDAGTKYTVKLRQTGRRVQGTYSPGGGTIEGEVDRRGRLIYIWDQAGSTGGTGVFILKKNGNGFNGTFSYSDDPFEVAGHWSGDRVSGGG